MRVRMVAFTAQGARSACSVAEGLRKDGDEVTVAVPERLATREGVEALTSLTTWTQDSFDHSDALVFVSACGIAVRALAPYVHDKLSDPAVVCMDERGSFVIPLLSGHVGGANHLAQRIADLCGAQAVVTTATDVEGVFAVDTWAASNQLIMGDRAAAKAVSAALLEGNNVGFMSDLDVTGTLPAGFVGGEEALRCPVGVCVSLDEQKRPFSTTLVLIPRIVTVGVGCRRGASAEQIAHAVDTCLSEAHISSSAVSELATIDVKQDEKGLQSLAAERGWPLRFYSAAELSQVQGSFSSSAFVQQTVGVDNVCERAACAAGARLLTAKRCFDGVTVALGMHEPQLSFDSGEPHASSSRDARSHGSLTCVGLGPGAGDDMTAHARTALAAADVIVGYTTYIKLIEHDFGHKELVATPMRSEEERCRIALERAAAGDRVALVCSGDPGVYGMAGLVLALSSEYPGVPVDIISGVTAAQGGAAVLGAPLMHDWCSISLSDLLTPWELIERRLDAAAQADFCICLYNPMSRGRKDQLMRACDVMLRWKDPKTPCGWVRNIGRADESYGILTLEELREAKVDMVTTIFVGNSQTRVLDGRMITPRGYRMGDA